MVISLESFSVRKFSLPVNPMNSLVCWNFTPQNRAQNVDQPIRPLKPDHVPPSKVSQDIPGHDFKSLHLIFPPVTSGPCSVPGVGGSLTPEQKPDSRWERILCKDEPAASCLWESKPTGTSTCLQTRCHLTPVLGRNALSKGDLCILHPLKWLGGEGRASFIH